MKRYLMSALCASVVLGSASALAQTPPPAAPAQPPPPTTFATALKNANNFIKGVLVASAEKMPEEHYSFRPTPGVRTYGELIGHVTDANYLFCARVKGEANPVEGKSAEKLTTKAELVKAIKDAVAYCDGAYGAVTDANVIEMITVPGPKDTKRQIARANPLMSNVAHNNEHYGNIVTYLRLKGLVPPSSEPPPSK